MYVPWKLGETFGYDVTTGEPLPPPRFVAFEPTPARAFAAAFASAYSRACSGR
jgi:hypothetical protein